MRIIRLTCYIAVLFLLQACASMGKDQCLTADWHTIGFEDGTRGLPAGRIAEHRRDCAKYGVTPNLKAYLAGRDQGLVQYCKPDNGFKVGESGSQYGGVCPERLEGKFLAGYRTGHHLYILRTALDSVQFQLDARRRELEKIKKRMAEKTEAVIDKKTTTKERVELLLDITRLNDQKHQVKHEIASLARERDVRSEDLASFQQGLNM